MLKVLMIPLILLIALSGRDCVLAKEFINEKEISVIVDIKLAESSEIEKLESYISKIQRSKDSLDIDAEKHVFLAKNKKIIEKSIENGKKYIPMIISILIKHNLPIELAFIPAVESGYLNGVKSAKGAAGIWQFVPHTARAFGLVVNKYVDERFDPIKSTYAAAKYLKYLYSIFGDWKLVLASYNAGHSKVITKVSYHGNSYYSIKRHLPKQTQDFIVKILAFSEEGKKVIKRDGILGEQEFEVITVRGGYDLKTISKISYIPERELKDLNKHFLKGVIPDDGNEYNLYVPKGYKKVVEAMLNS